MIKKFLFYSVCLMLLVGCSSSNYISKGGINDFSKIEPQWIRDGQPLEFEGVLWYPQDGVETFLDPEVYIVGQYGGVDVFVDKVDVRPYERLYTRFSGNHFRYFEKKL